ncbi:uncharacterized protein LOC104427057 isoform X3 [Eucalyptus grandis]|uniref:uncharacterized protein LOC104427057 isoform X3 n=1 Tax=Eucalyptus grandis TaxID=71139 RepID=UPI00192EF1D7|nr:uncharacterized protein LOC104427057 isoform X3 [Eucalyptus grandis]
MHKDQQLLLLLFLLFLLLPQSFSIPIENNRCTTSCGEIANISYPFRLKGDEEVCGDPNYELACVNNRTVLDLYLSQYHVSFIDYTNYTIRVVDVELQKGNCSSLPLHSLSCSSFLNDKSNLYKCGGYRYNDRELSKTVSIVNCTKAVASQLYIDASSCLDGVEFSKFSGTRRQLYAMVDANVSNMESACTIEHMAMIPGWADGDNLRSYAQIHDLMVYGFELSWLPIACKKYCRHYFVCDINDKHQIQCSAKNDIAFYLTLIAEVIEVISLFSIEITCYKLNLYCGIRFVDGISPLWLLLSLFSIGNITIVFSL